MFGRTEPRTRVFQSYPRWYSWNLLRQVVAQLAAAALFVTTLPAGWSSPVAGLSPGLDSALTSHSSASHSSTVNSIPPGKKAAIRPAADSHSSAPLVLNGVSVSVGYADSSSASPNFPVPWQGSPNITFIGGGASYNAGAVRLDNITSSAINIDGVSVDLQRPGPVFNLWGNFTIPAQGSVILTQTSALD